MKRRNMKMLAATLAAAVTVASLSGATTSNAAKALKMAKKSVNVEVGAKVTIKVKNAVKKTKVAWKTSKPTVAKITKKVNKGKKVSATVQGVKAGTATITATYKLGKKTKKLNCKVTVKAEEAKKEEATAAPSAEASVAPSAVPTTAASTAPSAAASAAPSAVPSAAASTEPSAVPSAAASTEPSAAPTSEATVAPTVEPTPAAPTMVPIANLLEDEDFAVPNGFKTYNEETEGDMDEIVYDSTVIVEGETVKRKANVALPKNYDPNKTYPVIYMMHGIFGNENSMIKSRYVLWNAIAEGVAEEAILVFPNGCANKTGGSVGPNNGFNVEHYAAYNNFLNDLEQCLMPYINENYPVYTDREHTAICGFSMGGRVTLHCGFSLQNKFRYIGAFCPAPGIFDFTDNGVSDKGLFTEDTFTLQDEYMNDTLVMIVKGSTDGVVKNFPVEYHEGLVANNVPHIYQIFPGGHDESVYDVGFYNFVRRIFK